MNWVDAVITGFFVFVCLLIGFLVWQLFKQKAENDILTLKTKDDAIEKTVDNLTLQQLVDDNNKRANSKS